MEAHKYLLVYLLPAVQLASSMEDKYKTLAEGIFSFFQINYGCHPWCEKKINDKLSKKQKHNRALKKVKQLKAEAQERFLTS